MQTDEIQQNDDEVQQLIDEMLKDNRHIVTIAQKVLLRCWCQLALHLKSLTVSREWARYLSELRQLSKVLSLEPGKPKSDETDLATLIMREVESD